jgi:hypothetical protein
VPGFQQSVLFTQLAPLVALVQYSIMTVGLGVLRCCGAAVGPLDALLISSQCVDPARLALAASVSLLLRAAVACLTCAAHFTDKLAFT